MNTNILKDIKVSLISLGCDKNRVDSEIMLGLLAGESCVFTPDMSQAQAIIINTCGFLQSAVEESREAILEAAEYKKSGVCRAVIVTGCAAERYKKEFFDESDVVDGILGVKEYGRIVDVMLRAFGDNFSRYVDYSAFDTYRMEERLHLTRIVSTPGHYAYLKIAEGCDKKCTYCTIPKIRGPFQSRTMDSLIDEAEMLAGLGVKELILVAQDTSLYGTDIYGKQVLHKLLSELSKIEGIHWLRLLYCYPEHIYDDLIAEIANNPKVAEYMEMPIQHASDKVLRLMNRRNNKSQLLEIIDKLRKGVPGITLRTTLISGFPGEEKSDFIELCEFIKTVQFDRLGVFAYSREEGTPADKLPYHLPEKTKEVRRDRLMKIQQEVSVKKLSKEVGSIKEVLIEGFKDGMYHGRSRSDAPEMDGLVYVASDKDLEIGSFIQVRITESSEYDLIGAAI